MGMGLSGKFLALLVLAAIWACGETHDDPHREFGPRLGLTAPTAAPSKVEGIDWSQESIYFLLVDRFSDGDPDNNFAEPQGSFVPYIPGETEPTALKTYQGGDLQGIMNRLEYIKSLGVSTIWLSPVYENADAENFGFWPYHGYHPIDFYDVEDRFGSLDLLVELVQKAHALGLKVILDIINNHAGKEHPFVSNLENWQDKGFHKWFHPHARRDGYTTITSYDYKSQVAIETKELAGLPDFNQDNPHVYEYLLDSSKFWIEKTGVDGFRLDTVRHVKPEFWARYNRDIKDYAGEDFLILGEVLTPHAEYVDRYDHLDFTSITDFPLHYAMVEAFAKAGSLIQLSKQVQENQFYYDPGVVPALFLDNHDVARFAFLAEQTSGTSQVADRIKLGLTFISSINGLPVIYYGTEIAMPGANYDDYLNRQFMDWPKAEGEMQNPFGITGYLRNLMQVRKENSALGSGTMLELYKNEYAYVYLKVNQENAVVVALNSSPLEQKLSIPLRYNPFGGEITYDGTDITGKLRGLNAQVNGQNLELTLSPMSAEIFPAAGSSFVVPVDLAFAVAESEYIKVDVPFVFTPEFDGISTVALAGSFNGWSTDANPMEFDPESGTWKTVLVLPPGDYEYKFVVNGDRWLPEGWGGNLRIEVRAE